MRSGIAPHAPFADKEHLCFSLVGDRNYVRALDVIALIERRIPNMRSLQARFLRPLTCSAVIALAGRGVATAAILRVTPQTGEPYEFAIANREVDTIMRTSDPPLHLHWALPVPSDRHRYLIFGRATSTAILAVAFASFQRSVGRRFVLRALHLEAMTSRIAELVAVHTDQRDRGRGERCLVTRNGRPWCRIDMVPADDGQSGGG